MLSKRQIRTMAKPYTDNAIIREGTKVVLGDGWWSNGYVIFFEKAPKKYPKKFDKDENCIHATKGHEESVTGIITAAITSVYPVELRPSHDDKESCFNIMTVLWFTDGDTKLCVDARYVVAIQKRHGKELTWTATGDTLVAHNGEPVAMLMKLNDPESCSWWDDEPTWDLKNEYITGDM